MRHNPPTQSELTVEELSEIALSTDRFTQESLCNLLSSLHNQNLILSQLRHKLSKELHKMWQDGLLTLCSRRELPCPVHMKEQ